MERQLITAAVRDRSAFEILISRGIIDDLSPPAQIVFEVLTEYYDKDLRTSSANVDLLSEAIKQKYPKHAAQFAELLEDLPESSSTNAVELWLAAKRQAVGNRLASALVNNSAKEIPNLLEEYEYYQNYTEEVPRTFVAAHPSELFTNTEVGKLLPIYPRNLNDALGGGVESGMHVVIFGVPEIGKTHVVLNAAAVMVQAGFKVLYCGNEDPPRKVLRRFLCRLTDMPEQDLKGRMNEAYEQAMQKGYDRFFFEEIIPGTIGELRNLIEKHEPDVIIVDQIRNLSIGDHDITKVLERAGIHMRNFAKKYGIVTISVTQAGDEAQGRNQVPYNMIQYSKVGLPATADVIIGVGASEDMQAQNKLVLTVSKNKINGNHAVIPARVNRTISKIKSEV